MKNSLQQFWMKFDQRPCTIITHDLLPDSGAILKIDKKSNFEHHVHTCTIFHTIILYTKLYILYHTIN